MRTPRAMRPSQMASRSVSNTKSAREPVRSINSSKAAKLSVASACVIGGPSATAPRPRSARRPEPATRNCRRDHSSSDLCLQLYTEQYNGRLLMGGLRRERGSPGSFATRSFGAPAVIGTSDVVGTLEKRHEHRRREFAVSDAISRTARLARASREDGRARTRRRRPLGRRDGCHHPYAHRKEPRHRRRRILFDKVPGYPARVSARSTASFPRSAASRSTLGLPLEHDRKVDIVQRYHQRMQDLKPLPPR